jgi:hypothetical protein
MGIGTAVSSVSAQEKKPSDAPRIIAVAPLEITRGTKTTLRFRGLKLDDATAVQVTPASAGIVATVGEKKKATLPNGAEAKTVGDTEVSVLLETPESTTASALKIAVTTNGGTTQSLEIPVVKAADFTEEKEPNGGFREAQPLTFGQLLRGSIKEDRDVDVYRVDGHSGKRLTVEVHAAGLSSMLDPVLTLYGAAGNFLQMNDDAVGRDPRLVATLPADGAYLISVTDAQDTGSPWHCYELLVKESQ